MTGLYLSGLAMELGQDRLPVTDAVAQGQYAADDATADGYVSVSREGLRAPYEMALVAAKCALAEARCNAGSLSAVVYASIHRHGQPRLWSPASWLQHQIGLRGSAPVLAVQQGCNGLLQAVVALAPLCRATPGQHVLLTGADRFEASGFDRWGSDYGLIYGDAAVAVTLSAQEGFARLLHLAIDGAPELEALHRDAAPSPETPESWLHEYDVRRSKKTFLIAQGLDGFITPLNAALARLRADLLAHPSWNGPVEWVLTPFVGAKIREPTYEAAFGSLGRQSGWQIGKTLGHLGTADGWVGLTELRRHGMIKRGDRVLIISAGVGFSCGLALIEIL
jgi:3-oxoacyl-[acyl-carrier-protein] synthase-3